MSGETKEVKKPRPSTPWTMLWGDAKQWNKNHNFATITTAVFVAINIVLWVILACFGHRLPLRYLNTTIADFNIGKLLVSLILTRGVLQMFGCALLIIFVLAVAESRMGVVRTVVVALVSALGGLVVGIGLCYGIGLAYQDVGFITRQQFTLSPVVLVIGALMAASAYSDTLMRRRIRLLGYIAILVMLLYGGNPGDYCVLAAALIGQIIGRVCAGAPKRKSFPSKNKAEASGGMRPWQFVPVLESRRIFGAISAIMALGPLTAITSPNHAGPLSTLGLLMSPDSVDNVMLADCLANNTKQGCFLQLDLLRVFMPGGVLRSLLPTAVMLVLAWGVYRGRRFAAIGTVVVDILQVFVAVVYYLFIPLTLSDGGFSALVRHGAMFACIATALPSLLFAVALIMSMSQFNIAVGWHRLAHGLCAMVIAFLACAGLFLIYGMASPNSFKPAVTMESLLAELPGRFLPIGFLHFSGLSFGPKTLLASVVFQGVGLVFWLVVLVVMLRWMKDATQENEAVRERTGRLVELGGESMSFMATWEGNQYWLSPSKRSAVAYRTVNGIALTCTGPFGDPAEWENDLKEFSSYCAMQSLTPVFYSVHREQRDFLLKFGWHSIEVGGEMVVDPRSWKTTGKKWQDIRTAINKAKREGITDVYSSFADAPFDVREQIEDISDEWTSGKALPEMKFTLGGVEELRDPRVKLLYAIDENGRVLGVTSWMPTWRDGRLIGWTLDFMRHRTDSPNGIMEFLIARMAQRLHDEGEADPQNAVEFMSLSAAPLAGMNPERDNVDENGNTSEGMVILQHGLQLVANLMEPAYGFRSLFNFKRKFQPAEEPVYVCYRDSAKLAQIGLAVVRAYVPTVTVKQAVGMMKTIGNGRK